jgi:hypothetical protein
MNSAPVTMAMSCSRALRRSPKPGAWLGLVFWGGGGVRWLGLDGGMHFGSGSRNQLNHPVDMHCSIIHPISRGPTLMAQTLRMPRSLLTTSVARASPETSSAMMRRGALRRVTCFNH